MSFQGWPLGIAQSSLGYVGSSVVFHGDDVRIVNLRFPNVCVLAMPRTSVYRGRVKSIGVEYLCSFFQGLKCTCIKPVSFKHISVTGVKIDVRVDEVRHLKLVTI